MGLNAGISGIERSPIIFERHDDALADNGFPPTLTPTERMDWSFPFTSRRVPVLASNVVSTSQPLAAQAGLAMLARGGNAVDAAIAAAAALVVVEPVMNGLGSDLQALVWDGERLQGLNSSGRSPEAWSPRRFEGHERMPTEGWDSVVVPGSVAGWAALSKRYGRLPFADLLEPAIEYAESGFMVSPIVAASWRGQCPRLQGQPGFADTFMPRGRAPNVGEVFRFAAAGRSLRAIAKTHGADFYTGEIAARIAAHAASHGGAMTVEDLARHTPSWVDPLRSGYRDLDIHQLPPNSQGLAVQMALGILACFDMSPATPADLRAHLQIEAMKVAFADVYEHVSDPRYMRVDASEMLDKDYLARRARAISIHEASQPAAHRFSGHSTVYVAAADRSGTMVSLIQSNFQGFGSGVVVPELGVSLNNRGSGFSLRPGHVNVVAGAKQPFHTIIPGFLSRRGAPLAALGVVGANMQPQGQMQIISALQDLDANPQGAVDAPRWRIDDEGRLRLEAEVDAKVAQALESRGHDVDVRAPGDSQFGGAQLVYRCEGGYIGASDPRRDGIPAGY